MYYPLSQITPNLYTNGGELVISSTLENYIGYYYETSTGEKYVGKIPQGNSSILLIPPPLTATEEETYSEKYVRVFSFPDDADPSIGGINEFVNQLTTIKYSYVSPQESPKIRKIPTSIKPYYTQEDLDRGEYKRYFAKKTNEFIYMEISLEDYKKLKSEASNGMFVSSIRYNATCRGEGLLPSVIVATTLGSVTIKFTKCSYTSIPLSNSLFANVPNTSSISG